jgi:hypothetical protein
MPRSRSFIIMFITLGSVLLPGEVDLEDEVEIFRLEGKMERVSTYRQMQALSYVLESIVLSKLLEPYLARRTSPL